MSKLDPTSESLESILASIRRSLSEQATDILADDGGPTPVSLDLLGDVVPGEDPPPRFLGGREASHPPEIPLLAETPLPTEHPVLPDRAFAGLDDPPPPASISATLARLTEESPPAAVATPPQPEDPPKEPLWFLGRGKRDGIPAPTPSGAPQPAAAQPVPAPPPISAAPAATPVLKEMVRGPLPPFFGSSPEAANVEVAPAPPMPGLLSGAAVIPPAPMPPALAGPPEAEPPWGTAPDSMLRAPAGPAGGTTREGFPNGKAHSVPVQPAAESTPSPTANPPATSPPQLHGLDAMVAELLRPMLRRWLDENMPRLVSAALKAEAETVSKRDPKKP